MNEIHEAKRAVAELLDAFTCASLSPCTSLALGNLAMVAGHGDDPSLIHARRRAAERGESALEQALVEAAAV